MRKSKRRKEIEAIDRGDFAAAMRGGKRPPKPKPKPRERPRSLRDLQMDRIIKGY